MTQQSALPSIVKNTVIMVYLVNPREKVWGLLIDLAPAGVWLRGMDLNSFDDWLRSLCLPVDQRLSPSIGFYPLARVEKILVEDAADGAGSLDARCLARTGRRLRDCILDATNETTLNETLGGMAGA